MFRSSLQRQVRLGNAACRQIYTLSSLRGIRIQTLEQQLSRNTTSTCRYPIQSAQLIPRFYSSASAEARNDAGSSNSQSGLVTRFGDLDRLGVHPKLIEAITQGMGYDTMTEVQSLTINPAMNGVDLVAQAKTGTGKTLAFLVPVFHRLLMNKPELAHTMTRRDASSEDIQAIIMSPTRELAEQIGVEATKLAKGTGIVVQTAVGGTRKREALRKMQYEGCHVLVATPGRLQDLLSDEYARVSAPNLKAFVLDEADRMLDVGFADAIRDILRLLPKIRDVDRQTLLYSATIPRDVVSLAKSLVKTDNFDFIQTINPDDAPTHEKVPQHVVALQGWENWFPAIMEIAAKAIEKHKQDPVNTRDFKAIVFFSNTVTVQFASRVFRGTSLGRIPLFEINSKLDQRERTRAADAFRRTASGILFSSDVTARGMDFPNVTHVIQVGLPPAREDYIHRVGRTGRAGKEGEGWLLLAEPEIAEARNRLPGLPLKPNHTLETAKLTVEEGKASEQVGHYFNEFSAAYSKVPRHMFHGVYNCLIGQKCGRRLDVADLVELGNRWCLQGLGWEQVPAVSARSASNRGLSRIPGIRIGFDEDSRAPDSEDRSSFGGSRDSSFGGSRGSGFGGSRGSSFGGSRDSGSGGSRGSGFGGSRGSSFGGSRDSGSGGSRGDDRRGGGFGGSRDSRFGGSRGSGFGGSRGDDRRGGGFSRPSF